MDIRRKAVYFQKETGLRPTKVQVSPDVAKGLSPTFAEFAMHGMERFGGLHPLDSIHGITVDGLTYEVLFTDSRNVVAFDFTVRNISAEQRIHMERLVQPEVSNVPPPELKPFKGKPRDGILTEDGDFDVLSETP